MLGDSAFAAFVHDRDRALQTLLCPHDGPLSLLVVCVCAAELCRAGKYLPHGVHDPVAEALVDAVAWLGDNGDGDDLVRMQVQL